jgi:hypothetical protein
MMCKKCAKTDEMEKFPYSGLLRASREVWLFNFFWLDGLWQRRLTTEDAGGTESCCFLCALCGFPKPTSRR